MGVVYHSNRGSRIFFWLLHKKLWLKKLTILSSMMKNIRSKILVKNPVSSFFPGARPVKVFNNVERLSQKFTDFKLDGNVVKDKEIRKFFIAKRSDTIGAIIIPDPRNDSRGMMKFYINFYRIGNEGETTILSMETRYGSEGETKIIGDGKVGDIVKYIRCHISISEKGRLQTLSSALNENKIFSFYASAFIFVCAFSLREIIYSSEEDFNAESVFLEISQLHDHFLFFSDDFHIDSIF